MIYFTNIMSITFIPIGIAVMTLALQWQMTLSIMNGVAHCLTIIYMMLHSENHDLVFPILGTLVTLTGITFMVKIYVEAYVNLDKI